VRWDLEEGQRDFFPAQIVVTAINEPGTLGMIATAIGDTGANIDNISINVLSPDFHEMRIDLEVADLKHLNTIMTQLRTKPVVSKAERVNG
jgi:GTP diphosphokinase / guanosine-3',5'-bis(diphosphate) 3'-diphosphatase